MRIASQNGELDQLPVFIRLSLSLFRFAALFTLFMKAAFDMAFVYRAFTEWRINRRMRFPKPPQLMTDEELTERVVASINQRLPESDSLDYKALLNIETRDERIELAKDASSFANEFGGTLLYGVRKRRRRVYRFQCH